MPAVTARPLRDATQPGGGGANVKLPRRLPGRGTMRAGAGGRLGVRPACGAARRLAGRLRAGGLAPGGRPGGRPARAALRSDRRSVAHLEAFCRARQGGGSDRPASIPGAPQCRRTGRRDSPHVRPAPRGRASWNIAGRSSEAGPLHARPAPLGQPRAARRHKCAGTEHGMAGGEAEDGRAGGCPVYAPRAALQPGQTGPGGRRRGALPPTLRALPAAIMPGQSDRRRRRAVKRSAFHLAASGAPRRRQRRRRRRRRQNAARSIRVDGAGRA